METFAPLIEALKIFFTSGVVFVKALIGVVVELFQLIVQFIKAGLSLLPK
ncbi:MAG: hypothetical protein HYW38_01750 [Candidatus Colwellbacteria bacterium]|nr:hypothetical protein [Candidatus Colwellbacteria bacterium]